MTRGDVEVGVKALREALKKASGLIDYNDYVSDAAAWEAVCDIIEAVDKRRAEKPK